MKDIRASVTPGAKCLDDRATAIEYRSREESDLYVAAIPIVNQWVRALIAKRVIIISLGFLLALPSALVAFFLFHHWSTHRDYAHRIVLAEAEISIKYLSIAVDAYWKHCGKMPTNLESLRLAFKQCLESCTLPPNISKNLFFVDPWNNPYQLEFNSTSQYTITSFGEDGLPSGSGNAKDIIRIFEAPDLLPEDK